MTAELVDGRAVPVARSLADELGPQTSWSESGEEEEKDEVGR